MANLTNCMDQSPPGEAPTKFPSLYSKQNLTAELTTGQSRPHARILLIQVIV